MQRVFGTAARVTFVQLHKTILGRDVTAGYILAIGAALPQGSARAQIVAELGTRVTEAGEAFGL